MKRGTPAHTGGVVLLLVMAIGAAPLPAQTEPGKTSWVVSLSEWGKWPVLASAIGLTTVAIFRNDDADEIFDGLITLCTNAPSSCQRLDDGTYSGSDAERLYQETLRLDRQARLWMIGGQVALAAAGAMFLIDLVSGDQGPKNIPFTGLEVFAGGSSLGVRYRF